MEWWLVLLAILICPIVMGGMMLWMVLHMRNGAAGHRRPDDRER